MNRLIVFGITVFLCLVVFEAKSQKSFTNCAAAFLNKEMIVNEYTPDGKCILSSNSIGNLTVCATELSAKKGVPKDVLSFKVAIRDHKTGTLFMPRDKSYTKVDIQEVLGNCKVGDQIVLIALNKEYALPHNEILVY